jgi:hypothetical protein
MEVSLCDVWSLFFALKISSVPDDASVSKRAGIQPTIRDLQPFCMRGWPQWGVRGGRVVAHLCERILRWHSIAISRLPALNHLTSLAAPMRTLEGVSAA